MSLRRPRPLRVSNLTTALALFAALGISACGSTGHHYSGLVAEPPAPAGGQVELKPGGYHVMLIGLKNPLKEGDAFPLTLTFETAGEVQVQADVRSE